MSLTFLKWSRSRTSSAAAAGWRPRGTTARSARRCQAAELSRPVLASVLATFSRWRTSTACCSTSRGGTASTTSHGFTAIAAATNAPTQRVAISSRFSSAVPSTSPTPVRGSEAAIAPATRAELTVKNTRIPAARTSTPSPLGRSVRSHAITADAATVASTKTAMVYACRCSGTRRPTERHHRCPCTTTAHNPAQPGDSSAAAAKNQTDTMLTCRSDTRVCLRTRSTPRPSSVCSSATTTSRPAVRGAAAVSKPAGGSSNPPTTSSPAQNSTAKRAVTSGTGRLQSFQRGSRVRCAFCDMRVLIVGGPDQAKPRSGRRRHDWARLPRLPT